MHTLKHEHSRAIGLFYLTIAFFSMGYTIYEGRLPDAFWLCYVLTAIMGIGFSQRHTKLILAPLSILTLPMMLWIMSFFCYLLSIPFLGTADYYFERERSLMADIISWQHFIVTPLGLWGLYQLRVHIVPAWLLMLVLNGFLFFVGRAFGPHWNINCAYTNCMTFSLDALPYPVAWFVIMLGNAILMQTLLCWTLSSRR